MCDTEYFNIELQNVCYSVTNGFRKGKKKILFDLNGSFPAGQLIAIMGPSGAGKSTLLNIVSGFETHGIDGTINVNDKERDLNKFKKVSCYITQENNLNLRLTVEENMNFAADFKLGPIAREKKNQIISDILEKFDLTKTRKTTTSDISGGQAKRLSVALELLSNPMILFLDEPTTGLDSFSTTKCINHLKYLAKEGRTIICTIHTPSASLFKMFDRVYVLAKGKCLYQGPTENLVPFFERIGAPCSIYHNPADYVIEIASGDFGEAPIVKMIDESLDDWIEYMKDKKRRLETLCFESFELDVVHPKKSNIYELCTLTRREFLKLKRNTMTTFRILTTLITSLGIGGVFYGMGADASQIWFNFNLLLAVIANSAVAGIMLCIVVVQQEKHLLRKEHFNRYYSLLNYYTVISLIDLPLSLICSVVGNIIIYYLTQQPWEYERLMMFLVMGILIAVLAQSVGLLVSTMMDLQNAVFVASYLHIPLLMLSGIGASINDMPTWLRWVPSVNYVHYTANGFANSIYGYNRTNLECPEDKYCVYSSGTKFLTDMGLALDRFDFDCYALIFSVSLIKILSYIAMDCKMKSIK